MPSISVRGVSKVYQKGGMHHDTLRGLVAGLFRSIGTPRAVRREAHWALRNVTFRVMPGEVVGIVGDNGAGKSTLLKVLSRITSPTSGEVILRGRVGSLLEVGTGFHPELTGRENIFMNGAILGMTRSEIEARFEDIVHFSGVSNYLDTPVKWYSSGMYVRLAFAIAANVDVETLIVDEVLAVGDAAFRQKCIKRMNSVAEDGRTVLFVSHSLGLVQSLCTRVLVLEAGSVVFDGPTANGIQWYLERMQELTYSDMKSDGQSSEVGDSDIGYEGIEIDGPSVGGEGVLIAGRSVTFRVRFRVGNQSVPGARFLLSVYSEYGVAMLNCDTQFADSEPLKLEHSGVALCSLERLPLAPGRYRIAVAIHARGHAVVHIPKAAMVVVGTSEFFASGLSPDPSAGVIMVEHDWRFEA